MADVSVRKRSLTDSIAPLARPLKAVYLTPAASTPESKPAAASPAATQAQQAVGDHVAKPEQQQQPAAAAAQPGSPGSGDTSPDADLSPTSPVTPSRCEQSEQQSAYLLMKACEREEAAEDRAEEAEAALDTSNRKLRETETLLQAAQERIKLLEVQLLNRAVSHAKLDGLKAADAECQAISEDSKSQDSEGSAATDMHLQSGGAEEWPRRPTSFDWDSAQVDCETLQLRLELEATHARLTMSRESEQKATEYAEAAGTRLDAFAGMLRGAADVAFCGNDASARRLRHHLFRCLDVDCDGFLGGGDLQHWYRSSEHFLETQGYDPVCFEALQAQLADALYNPTLPNEFLCRGKVSLMQLSRSNMGAGIVASLLNLDNLMQDRNTSEWGAPTLTGSRSVPLS
jgi:hypothetical protein